MEQNSTADLAAMHFDGIEFLPASVEALPPQQWIDRFGIVAAQALAIALFAMHQAGPSGASQEFALGDDEVVEVMLYGEKYDVIRPIADGKSVLARALHILVEALNERKALTSFGFSLRIDDRRFWVRVRVLKRATDGIAPI